MESFACWAVEWAIARTSRDDPLGYSREQDEHSNEAWDEIHCLLRHLLLDRSFYAYDERIAGYTTDKLAVWAWFISHYEASYPLGYAEAGIHLVANRSLEWTQHLWLR